MNHLKTYIGFLLLMTFGSCTKDLLIQPGANELYTPYLTSTRNFKEVTLKWGRPACELCGSCVCPQLNPYYFEILISDTDPSEFDLYTVVSNNVFELTIDNLTNGTPYYFAIKAVGHNTQFTVSKTIMTIPNNPENIQPLFQETDKERIFGTWSPDKNSVAYVSDYTWNNGNNGVKSVFISILSNNEEWLVEKSSSSPDWSPTGRKIAYHTHNGEVQPWVGYTPTHIAIYNIQDSTTKRLTDGNSFNFLATWSPDGNWIAFLSDKAGGSEYNLWKIPSDSGAAIQITSDFKDLTDLAMKPDRSLKNPSWSKDGNEIVFSRLKKVTNGYVLDIYSIPSTGGSRKTVISSQWNDSSPTYAPDGSEIAFISDRSGLNEIWSMNLQTKKLRQITGSYEQWIYDNWGKIEWSATGDKILFTSNYDHLYTLYTVNID